MCPLCSDTQGLLDAIHINLHYFGLCSLGFQTYAMPLLHAVSCIIIALKPDARNLFV